MIEITIKTDNESTLERLLKLIATYNLQATTQQKNGAKVIKIVNAPKKPNEETEERDYSDLPIVWSKNPEKAEELFGIWKDKNIDAKKLRKLAWGDRA